MPTVTFSNQKSSYLQMEPMEGVSGGHLSPTQDAQTCRVHVELTWVLNILTHSVEPAFLLRTIHNKNLLFFERHLPHYEIKSLITEVCSNFFLSSFFEITISEQICQANRLLTEAWFDVSVIHCHC